MFNRCLAAFSQSRSDDAMGEQGAEFGATFGGRHLVGRERIGAFHHGGPSLEGGYIHEKPVPGAFRDIEKLETRRPNTDKCRRSLPNSGFRNSRHGCIFKTKREHELLRY